MSFEKKFNLTVEENIFVAKRNIVDYIWKSAKLEGLSVTFPDTNAIYEGMSVANVPVNDVIAVNNLKHSWQFIFDTIDTPVDFRYLSQLNEMLRVKLVSQEKFDLPDRSAIEKNLDNILKMENPTERCITLMLYCMRSQIFLDGNKRVSMLAANHEMIRNGCGIISVPIEEQPKFTELLIQFYETNEMDTIKQFIYDKCIDGIDFEAQRNAEKNLNP